jgi:phosphoglycerate kinase
VNDRVRDGAPGARIDGRHRRAACPAYAGLLMERELEMLSKLLESAEKPFAAILGGAKVSDKIGVIDNLLKKVDVLVLGGGMANTFLLAQGKSVGKSLAEHDRVDDARRILARPEKRGVRSSCRST